VQPTLATLDTAVARAKAAGLYVVIDMIHLWDARGARGQHPDVRICVGPDALHGLIATIRRVAPEKIVLVEPTYGDTAMQGTCADLSNLTHRANVVVSIHAYFLGGDDDGFGPGCRQAGRYAFDRSSGYQRREPGPLRAHLRAYLDALRPAGIPLYVGEFGIAADVPNRDRWVRDMVDILDEYRLGRAWWEYWTSAKAGALSATYRDGAWRPFADLLVATPAAKTPVGTPTADPVVMAAGDFTGCQGRSACARSNAARVKAVMAAEDPDAILAIGDFQYPSISSIDDGFDLIFGSDAGAGRPTIYPTAGPTHDVMSCTDRAYADHWGRSAMTGYSFDLGSWHIISLPSAVYRYGCDTAGVLRWLTADLAADRKPCTLAFWQDPYWTRPTASHMREPNVRPWVEALYDDGADVVLQASNHDYQRFAPQNPRDDRDPAHGLRAFVVGTGGVGHYGFTGSAANVEASDETTHGALKLVLHPNAYDWEFEPAADGSFTDAGSDSCH
jgi:hypothetical protein